MTKGSERLLAQVEETAKVFGYYDELRIETVHGWPIEASPDYKLKTGLQAGRAKAQLGRAIDKAQKEGGLSRKISTKVRALKGEAVGILAARKTNPFGY